MTDLPNDKFCVLPWISLETSPIGTVRPCCLADGEITDEAGNKYRVNETSLTEIQNSKYMDSLRQEFLAGNQPKLCRRCWSVEDAGGTSKRLHTLDRLKHVVENINTWSEEPKALMFVDFKLGNICNLSCRICGSWSSSTYAVEELKQLPGEKKKQSFAYQMLEQGRWPRESAKFWEELEFLSDELRYLEFTGGEPFMIQEHFQFLQGLVDRGLSRNIEIHYNTNGTIYPAEHIDLWREFKHVEIAFSIDDVGLRFEYQRDGANWIAVNNNIKDFIKLSEQSPNISLQICTTVNIFNVYYLESIAQWNEQMKPYVDFIYWNMLHDAPEHCIKSLPQHAKEIITKKLESAQVSDEFRNEFQNIVKFMKQNSTVTIDKVRENLAALDQRKNQNMKSCMPDLYELIFNEKA